MTVDKKVNLTLQGLDGNAFVLCGHFRRQAQFEGWTQAEIDAVLNEAKSGNYTHLVATLSDHCENDGWPDDDDDDCEDDMDDE